MTDRYEDYLRAVPMFRGLSHRELAQLASVFERVTVPAGAELVVQGSTSEHEFFLILDGFAQVLRDGRQVATLGRGDYFGELALLDPAPRNATVRMTTPGELLIAGQREFWGLVDTVPALSRSLLAGLAQRVRAAEAPTPEDQADGDLEPMR